MASTSLPDDMEFINMALQASRPDGKPPVPVWVATEDDLVYVYIIPRKLTYSIFITNCLSISWKADVLFSLLNPTVLKGRK